METKKQEKVKEDIETIDYEDDPEEDIDEDDNDNLWE